MSKQDSGGPKGYIESSKVPDREEGKERTHDDESQKFVPAENDRKVTVEDFNRFIASDERVKLEKIISAWCFDLKLGTAAATDVYSQTMVELLKAVHDGKVYESKFKGFRSTIAYRLAICERRKRNRENGYTWKNKKKAQEQKPEITARPRPKTFELESLPERRCASPEGMAFLKDAIGKLTPIEQQLFILDNAGFSDMEIAEQLKISAQNVRTKRCRATQRLNR